MGEVNVPQQKDAGRPARKILSTRVDLTPMVDLGFLLITFFIFTTKIGEPKVMDLALPAKGDSSKTGEEKTLNLVLGENDRLWYYSGNSIEQISATDYSAGIRKIIKERRDYIGKVFKDKNELVVLIKPTTFSSYKNVIDVFDEMTISGVTRHVLMDPSEAEMERIRSK